jgi:Ca2+/Na+ antiporter
VIVNIVARIKMKIAGFLLLLSGWGIVLAALRLLHGAALSIFIVLGLSVEILGLVLFAWAHLPVAEGNR